MKTEMKKISIIIPNYNNEKYILECLNSILSQDYLNKEIIIVDDGSTDGSLKIIEDFVSANKKEKIYLVHQNNLNAAIARNKGIEMASGEYVLFFDSDDVLAEGALRAFSDAFLEFDTDLVIGNFATINERGENVGETIFTKKTVLLNVKNNFDRLADFSPVPMNKMYKMDVIKKNNIFWGNVKIGQDLDFYLKYLLVCNKVVALDKNVYNYRLSNNSISRSYDFRIFDIVNTFFDIEKFYVQNGEDKTYKKYLPFQMLKHYDIQMTKQVFFKERKVRNMVMKFFLYNMKKIDFSVYDKSSSEYLKLKKKIWIKRRFRLLYTSYLYCRYKLRRMKNEG